MIASFLMFSVRKEVTLMKYSKPEILTSGAVKGAVCCGGVPCGRPCDRRA